MLPATLFLEYKRIGNRSNYEGVNGIRRNKLRNLVVAECAEGKGRFLDEIVNGLWATCEETFWGYPAHLSPQKAGPGLPISPNLSLTSSPPRPRPCSPGRST